MEMLAIQQATIGINALQWSTLDGCGDVQKISNADAVCLAEIREVLNKYKQVDRLGVSLLHTPFTIGEDEILMETTNNAMREHRIAPMKKADLDAAGYHSQTTILRFDNLGWSQHCGCVSWTGGHAHG